MSKMTLNCHFYDIDMSNAESLMKNPRLDYAGRGQRPAFYYSNGMAQPSQAPGSQAQALASAQNDP